MKGAILALVACLMLGATSVPIELRQLQANRGNLEAQLASRSTLSARAGHAGVTREVIQEGDDVTRPSSGDKVTFHYVGKLVNGEIFDSSNKDLPMKAPIGEGKLIRGIEEGILLMTLGERCRLTISPDYGYTYFPPGEGLGPDGSTLIFEIELLSIEK